MNKKLHILHLEDSKVDAEIIQAKLVKDGLECEIKRVETREDFIAAIEKGGFDVILSDYSLPSFNGLSALMVAKEQCPDVPFILVSGAVGEELAIDILKKGATDYVLKGNLSRLVPAVHRAIEEAH
ncbi:MAG: response regulator, partial [Thermodesulfovibrionales bacterium]|nr:response regulator [Thermodesulfovibrionales bacterium]